MSQKAFLDRGADSQISLSGRRVDKLDPSGIETRIALGRRFCRGSEVEHLCMQAEDLGNYQAVFHVLNLESAKPTCTLEADLQIPTY